MRIFMTSTPEELSPHRSAAVEVAQELGVQVVHPAHAGGVSARAQQVAGADLVLALVGHRRGHTPPPELGGDGFHPWPFWETRAAFERGVPVKAVMAAEEWHPELQENDAKARSLMRDFRGELSRLATFFDSDAMEEFRDLVRDELLAAQQAVVEAAPCEVLKLRRWPSPSFPPRPYPVLLPYTHPDLMAGRERELAELQGLLARPVPILGLHAVSGAGKSSLLAGGLVPGLRAAGRPVAFDRHPGEPGIAHRLLADLLADGAEYDSENPRLFTDRLRDVCLLAKAPPVLVLDQFEDLLRDDDKSAGARRTVGALLASAVQRQPGLDGPVCRFLLAYRREFHGQVFQWLRDVSRDATGWGDLPHDLSDPDRFQAWTLPPLGAPAPGTERHIEAASDIFLAAIEKPLALTSAGGEPVYLWRFAVGAAARLARIFGEARVARRGAPLAPELQVVLAHLLTRSRGQGEIGRAHV